MSVCETFRERIHEIYDGDDAAAVPGDVRDHVAGCASCREAFEDLAALRSMLRSWPPEPLPSDALDAVWRRTLRAPRGGAHAAAWMRAAAAAVLVTGLLATSYLLTRPSGGAPSDREIARAEAQADLVLGCAARALDAARAAAADRVLAGRISPAVRGSAAASRAERRLEP